MAVPRFHSFFKNEIVNDFTTVATDAVVTDIVPAGFEIKKGTLPAGATAIENKEENDLTI